MASAHLVVPLIGLTALLLWMTAPAVVPASANQPPTLTAEVDWLMVKPGSHISFVGFVHNHSEQTRSGVRVRWDALDANGQQLTTFTSPLPPLPAGSHYPYVGGSGRGSLNEPEAPVMRTHSIRLTVVDEGRPTDERPTSLTVWNVTVAPASYRDPILDRGFLGYDVRALWKTESEPVPWACITESAVLRDASGAVVGAQLWRYFAPEPASADTTYRLHVHFQNVDTIGPAETAQVLVDCRPAQGP
jgi:hypothetical protein